jgi:hypothetical protein
MVFGARQQPHRLRWLDGRLSPPTSFNVRFLSIPASIPSRPTRAGRLEDTLRSGEGGRDAPPADRAVGAVIAPVHVDTPPPTTTPTPVIEKPTPTR